MTHAFPLVGRPMEAVLFYGDHGPITTARFLALAHRLAATLPDDAPAMANSCRDPCRFALGLAACVLRGKTAMLAGSACPAMQGLPVILDEHVCLAHAAPSQDNPMIPALQPVATAFTSGSTGQPVGHRKTWGALAARSLSAARQFGLREDQPVTTISTVLPQHMYGFETTVMQPLHAPSATLCGDAFHPADIADRLHAAPAPRFLITTPLHVRAALQANLAWPGLHAIISATAPLDPELAQQAGARWQTEILEIYGSTETGSMASRCSQTSDPWRLYDDVRIVTNKQTVCMTAPFASIQPVADHIALVDDRHFRLLGRPGDMIKLGGRRASLTGLNCILNRLEGVEDGVFVPPPSDEACAQQHPVARMMAFVVAPNRSPDSILASLREQIDPVFLPRRIVALPALPRNATGKLPRQALEDLIRYTNNERCAPVSP